MLFFGFVNISSQSFWIDFGFWPNTWNIHEYPSGQKVNSFWGVFSVIRLSTFCTKTYFPKKADPKHCENGRRESGSEFHKTSPMCERGGWRKQLRDLITQSLKQTPLSTIWNPPPVPFGSCCGLMGLRNSCCIHVYSEENNFSESLTQN